MEVNLRLNKGHLKEPEFSAPYPNPMEYTTKSLHLYNICFHLCFSTPQSIGAYFHLR